MGGGDQLSFTDAMGGAKCATEILQRSKLQPTDFARWLAEILVPAAVDVNAAARPDPAAPMPPAAQPDGRACGAASRRLPAAAAARGWLSTRRWSTARPTLHVIPKGDWSSQLPNTFSLLCITHHYDHLMGADHCATRRSLLRPPLPSPPPSPPPVASQNPVASRATAGVGYRPQGGFQLGRRAPRRGWRCL